MAFDPRSGTGRHTDHGEGSGTATVQPNSHSLGTHGPLDWDDMITHEGEARGLADTAYSTLEPDAPTVEAARCGHAVVTDRAARGLEISGEDNGPDS
jgi:hypothetical protein